MPEVWDITFRHSATIKHWDAVSLPPTQFYRVDLGIDPHKTFYVVNSSKDRELEGGDYWWLQDHLITLKTNSITVHCKYPHDDSVSGKPTVLDAARAEAEIKETQKGVGSVTADEDQGKATTSNHDTQADNTLPAFGLKMKGRQELAASVSDVRVADKKGELSTVRKSLNASVADWSDSEDEDGWWSSPKSVAPATHPRTSGPSLLSSEQFESLAQWSALSGEPGPLDEDYREDLRTVLDTVERYQTNIRDEKPIRAEPVQPRESSPREDQAGQLAAGNDTEQGAYGISASRTEPIKKSCKRPDMVILERRRKLGRDFRASERSYGLKASDVLTSEPSTPQIAICPAKPLPKTPAKAESVASDRSEPVLSPNSQKTLRKMYLDELLSAGTNTPASKQVLKIIEFEDVSLDTSLGLRLLDLAKALRSDGEYGKASETSGVEEKGRGVLMMTKVLDKLNTYSTKMLSTDNDKGKTPEKVEPEDRDRDIGLLMMTKVLDKLNDHSGMLNAIAEQVGVNLLDDDEAEMSEQAASKVAEPPSTLTDSIASLALSDSTAAESSKGDPSDIPAVTVPAAVRIAEVAAGLHNAPDLFSPKPVDPANLTARPLPSTDTTPSETSNSEDESDTPAETPTVANSQSTTPRNPFADPPRFGQSYGPLRPLDAAFATGVRSVDPVTGAPPSAGFARYAAPPSGSATRDFWHNVDSYASPPASVFGGTAGPRPPPGRSWRPSSQDPHNHHSQGFLFGRPPGRPTSMHPGFPPHRPQSPNLNHHHSHHGLHHHHPGTWSGRSPSYAYVGPSAGLNSHGDSAQSAQYVWNGYEYVPLAYFGPRDPRGW